MDNQLAKSQISTQLILAIALIVAILVATVSLLGIYWPRMSDPYVRQVLAIPGDVARGEAIFQINCAACHGLEADGSVGPSLENVPKRKSKAGLIYQVTSGQTPPMPKFQPTPQEMADLLSYLEQL